MRSDSYSGKLITDMNVREYFQESISSALTNQQVKAADGTIYYVVNLLTYYARADHLFEQTADGLALQPLAMIYSEAVEASSVEERDKALQRLGDIALLISGLFSDSLNRKLVDVDYYIAMGGSAYGYLSGIIGDSVRGRTLSIIFDELSNKFQAFVDVLSEVSEKANLTSHTDIMRLYEIWMRTGSKRAASRLRKHGIEPLQGSISRKRN